MFVSLDHLSIGQLESARSLLNALLAIATLAVLIGVYFEKDGNPEDVKKWGWGILAKGISLELFCEFLLWQTDSLISARQQSDLAATYERAASAEKAAGEANERAAKAELELAKLKKPRKMTNAQMQKFVATLRLYPGSSFWVMVQKSGSSKFGEQIAFGRQLSEAFTLANWKKTNRSEKDKTRESPEFTEVADRGCSAAAETLPLANIVSDALKEAEIYCVATEDPSLIPNLVFIEVGLQ